MSDPAAIKAALLAKLEGGGSDSTEESNLESNKPDPMSDEILNERIDEKLRVDRVARLPFESEWFRTILYFMGEQYITKDKGRWRRKTLPKWLPRTITNKIAEKTNDLVAVLSRGRVPIRYIPESDQPDDIATANLEETLRDVIYEEAGVEYTESIQAAWVATTGNAFRVQYYDLSEEHGTREIQQARCPGCQAVVNPAAIESQVCPECQYQGNVTSEATPAAAPVEPEFADESADPNAPPPQPPQPNAPISLAVDESGAPVNKSFPIGALASDVCSPFEIRLDYSIPQMKDHRWYQRLRLYDRDFAKMKWADQADEIDKIEKPDPGTADSLTLYYLSALSRITSSFLGSGQGGKGGKDEAPKVLVYELVELPSDKYPDGLRVIRLGSKCIVEKGANPYEIGAGARKGKKFLNLAHFGGEVVPGRIWRKTRLTDLIPLQDFRNILEAAIKITIHRAAGPSWLNPIGSQVAMFSGEPLQQIDYVPISFGGTSFAKPEMVAPQLSSVHTLGAVIDSIDASIEKIAGTYFVQGGDAPQNVSAASALALLDENAQRAIAPLIREWAKGYKQFEMQSIEILRAHAIDGRILSAAGRNRTWEVKKFTSADLTGAVKVKVDYEGVVPKSQATDRATIIQMTQMGYLSPFDPQIANNVLQKFGLSSIQGSAKKDWEQASREFRDFMDENEPPLLIPLVQNSGVHIAQHCDDTKGDEFKQLRKTDPTKAQQWLDHIQAHAMDLQARAAMSSQFTGGIGNDNGEGGAKPGKSGQSAGGASKGQPGAQAGAQSGNGQPLGPTPDLLAPSETNMAASPVGSR